MINADERATWLGGSLMPEPVLGAMAAAAGSYVDLFDLQHRIGRRLATLTCNDAAYVSTGAAAGLVLATLACATGPDPAAIARLADRAATVGEIIVYRVHRSPYDPAVRLAGAELVAIGGADRTSPED